ncbi:MAG: cell division protein FtsZ [Lachnospiraceae bacterium]|nr:cell division protein FtsZ [Lachnospiraceae bacterium]
MLEISNNTTDSSARLMVMGVGGAGCNAINRMIDENVSDVEFVAVNTDRQDLDNNKATNTLQIGEKLTNGLGAGAKPEIGEKSAEESIEEINATIKGVDMLFITAGMGGGTGTGASPVIAKAAKEQGILTVAVVTKPFEMEQKGRMRRAIAGIDKLMENVDTLIVIPNQKLFSIIDSKTSITAAFQKADEVLQQCIRGITDLITINGVINLDFADVKSVMSEQGYAHMGFGVGKGDNKFKDAVKMAVESPLLETSLNGAKNLILNITGDKDMALVEANDAANYVTEITGGEVELYLGVMTDESLTDEVRFTLIATGIDEIEGQTVKASSVSSTGTSASSIGGLGLGLKYDNATLNRTNAATSSTAPKSATRPQVKQVAPKPAMPQPANTISQPSVKPSVEAKDIQIPDFLSKK